MPVFEAWRGPAHYRQAAGGWLLKLPGAMPVLPIPASHRACLWSCCRWQDPVPSPGASQQTKAYRGHRAERSDWMVPCELPAAAPSCLEFKRPARAGSVGVQALELGCEPCESWIESW